jgi:TPR repeat protein
MASPDDDDPVRSELEYAPPWVREQAEREQASRGKATREEPAREQAAREQPTRGARGEAPREQTEPDQSLRDQLRMALRQSGVIPLEQVTQDDPDNRGFGDDRPWHQRALEPELVPEPPAGTSNVGPIMLRMGAVCVIAAMVAGAVVFLFSPKQTVHKIAQANVSAPAIAADDASPSSMESSRGMSALTIEEAANASAQVASAAPPQAAQAETASAPALPQGQAIAPAPPKPQSQAAAPPQQIASLPAPNTSPANIGSSRAPAVDEPPARPADLNPAGSEPRPAANPAPSPAPAQTAPAQAVPANVARPAVVLDQNEITTLIRRGKTLLSDGDFAGARVLFERAANAGSAEAALALGSTYDPSVIKRLGAIMVKPDIETARKWYQLAADRGSAAASLQLANLPQGR